MNKKDRTLILCIIYSIFIIAFDIFKFDLITRVKGSYGFGASIVLGFLLWIPYILYGILAIWTVFYIFKKVEAKRNRTFIPMIIMLITTLLLFFFPYTKVYLALNYSLNKECFQKTVQMMNNREMRRNKIGMDMYIAPYRSTSYSGILYTEVKEDVTKILFYAYDGLLKDVVIVYSSDDSGIDKRDFKRNIGTSWNFSNVKKIEDNWYSVEVAR